MTYIVDRADIVVAAEIVDGTFTFNNRNYSVIHKFGRNIGITTSFLPVALGGIYRMPQVAGATKLRVKAGNTNDTALGSGARSITIQGLDATGALVTEDLPTAGLAAGANSTNTYIRLFRAYIATAGTFSTTTGGAQAADIIIEDAAGSEDWLTISATDFDRGQSQVACYTVPLGKTGYIQSYDASVDIKAAKPISLLLMQRQNILETAAPYTALRTVEEFDGIEAEMSRIREVPLGPFPALTDLIWLGKAAATSGVSINFTIMLVDEL